ncbi:hypothetical protein FRC01_002206 [Tulasnella sp. 417]|nr:hypothetical protein FRC01_002206 [Tulasnella sp. 417]
MFNFACLAIVTGKNTQERIILSLKANFLTATGWVMTVALAIMNGSGTPTTSSSSSSSAGNSAACSA